MMKKRTFFLAAMLCLGTLLVHVSDTLASSPPQEFYKGKTMKLIVPFRPGGGFDAYARALVKYIKKYTNAKHIVIINKPGAGGNIAYNELYNSVEPKGLTICIAQGETLAYNKLWDLPEAKYKPEEFSFFGRVVWEESCTLLGTMSPYKSFEDLKKAKLFKAACPGISDKSGTAISVAAEALGLNNLKKVVGYGGSREALAAVLRGEADVAPGFSVSGILKFVQAGNAVPLWVDSTERSPKLPQTPTIYELGGTSGREGPLNLYVRALRLGRVIIGPPGIPADRLKFLTETIGMAIKDPGYSKDLEKMKRDKALFLEGEKCLELMKQVVGITKEEKEELKRIVFKKGT